ncbi:MAG: hypothetical protein R6X10_10020 [Desulfobacterales bacterium]
MKKYIILVFICLNLIWAGPAAAIDGLGDVEIHGFVAQGYLQSDKYDYLDVKTDKGSFEYSEMGINFSVTPVSGLRIGAQFFARDLGDLGNDEIELDWAYGDYRVNNYLGVRGGKMKVAMGLYNEVRDVDAVRTFIMMPNSIYLEQNRDTYAGIKGVGLYGELPGGFSYQAAFGVNASSDAQSNITKDIAVSLERKLKLATSSRVTQTLISFGVPAEYAAAQGAAAAAGVSVEPTDSTGRNTKNGALQWAPRFLDGLRLSGTYFGGETETFMDATVFNSAYLLDNTQPTHVTVPTKIDVDEISSTIVSAEYMIGDTLLSGEYAMIKVDIDSFLGNPVPTLDVLGWAVSASHRFKDQFEIGMYYSDYNTDVDDYNGKDWEKETGRSRHERYLRDVCLAGRVDITEGWIFKLEGHLMRGLDNVEHGSENDPTWYLYAAKVSYNF